LPRHHEIIGVASLAGKCRRSGVGADIDRAGIEDVGHGRARDIREHDAGEQLDILVLQQAIGDLLALPGLGAVVLDHDLNRDAAQFAASDVNRELKAVADILAEVAAGTGQRRDHADLDCIRAGLLAERRQGDRPAGRHGYSQDRAPARRSGPANTSPSRSSGYSWP